MSTDIKKAKIVRELILLSSVLMGYILVRFLVYLVMPVGTDEAWIYRDFVMNLPRIVGGLIVLYFLRDKLGGEFSFKSRDLQIAPWIASLMVLLLPFGRSYFVATVSYPSVLLILAIIGSVFVGLFEETLFRFGFLDTLRTKYSVLSGLSISSVLFSLFHIQAQPIESLPLLFVFGLFFGLLRLHGLSLISLVTVHVLYDSLLFVWAAVDYLPTRWTLLEFAIVTLVVIYLMMTYRKVGGIFSRSQV